MRVFFVLCIFVVHTAAFASQKLAKQCHPNQLPSKSCYKPIPPRHRPKPKRAPVEKKDYDDAVEHYASLVAANAQDVQAQIGLAGTYAVQANYPLAEAMLKNILQKKKDSIEAIALLANINYWQGKYEASLAILDDALAHFPKNYDLTQLRHRIFHNARFGSGYSLRTDFHYENFSFFNPPATGGNYLASYVDDGWGVRAGMYYLNKYNNNVTGLLMGGTYYFTPQATLSLDVEFGFNAVVTPIQGYEIIGSYTFLKAVTPSLGYRFAQYAQGFVQMIEPGIVGAFADYFSIRGKLYATFTTFPVRHQTLPTVSFLLNLTVTPIDRFSFSVGYALDSQAFDPGNPALPIGGYIGNDFLIGLYPVVYGPLSLAFNGNYELRTNGYRVFTLDATIVLVF